MSRDMSRIDQLSRKLSAILRSMVPKTSGKPCPHCGADFGEMCELNSGTPRNETHGDRPSLCKPELGNPYPQAADIALFGVPSALLIGAS
jgi:hypothetical protein